MTGGLSGGGAAAGMRMADGGDATTVAELLLLEDHALLRATTALALEREGFVVHHAGDAPGAMRLLNRHPAITVGVLEIDLGHDKPNGFAFADSARALRPGLGLLLLTGRADLLVGRARDAREAHLVKPSPIQRVVDTIRRLLPS